MDLPIEKIIIGVGGFLSGPAILLAKRLIASRAGIERAKIADERQDKDLLWDRVSNLEEKIGLLEGRIHALETEKENLIKENATKDVTIARLEADNARLQDHNDALEERNRELEVENSRLKAAAKVS
jgi:peptidoglycan hydrolase CwlO-like protein